MDCFPVRKQDNAKVAIIHLRYYAPAPDSPICLNYLSNWRIDGAPDPRILNQRTIGTLTDRFEVTRELHATRLTERTGVTVAA